MAIHKLKRRSLLFVGDVGIPESTHEAEAANAQRMGPNLRLLIASEPQTSAAQAATAGVDLLRLAATGQSVSTYGAHQSIRHAASLDNILSAAQSADVELTVKKVAVGALQSLALLSTGQLIMLSSEPSEHASAMIVGAVSGDEEEGKSGLDVLDVAAGVSHFVLCTDVGTVYTFGWSNEFGQLGDGTVWRVGPQEETGSRPILTDPRRIPGFGITVGAPERQPCIIAVAAGDHHTVLLSASKTTVYVAGRGQGGQLGLAKRAVPLQPTFKSVPSLFGCEMRSIAAAANHTFALLECGKLFGFGENAVGALGTGDRRCQFVPTEVRFLLPSKQNNKAATESVSATELHQQQTAPAGEKVVDPRVIASIKAPYGSPLSYMYPRRIDRISCEMPAKNGVVHPIDEIYVSRSLTIARSALNPEILFSCGMHLPVNPLTQSVERNGVLARPIREKFESFVFGEMQVGRPSSAASQGWGIALGDNGFVALADRQTGQLRLQGTVAQPCAAVAPSHLASVARIPAAPALSSLGLERVYEQRAVNGALDSVAVPLGTRKLIEAIPCKDGLFLLVEDQ